jgi:CRISPR-associated endonuclease/helicase Cas3
MKGDIPPYEECWAKTTEDGRPGISVRDHCLNVGCVAETLLKVLSVELQRKLPQTGVATLAALHDVGKVSPGFQVKSETWLMLHTLREQALKEGWQSYEADHAKVGQFTVQNLLRNSRLHQWAAVVGAHHGRIKGERVLVHEPWEEERLRLVAELMHELGPLPDEPPQDGIIWFVAGLITIADWIGSDERYFPQVGSWGMPERRKRAESALATINWRRVKVRKLCGFRDLFPEIPKANSLQTAAMQVVREPGIHVIEGPMGCGKTEAALAAAYQLILSGKATGLYFALPTQVTSNRIHLRVQPFVERVSADPVEVRLAHSASWLIEAEPPAQLSPTVPDDEDARDDVRAGRSWFASPKRALLAPFGVGTIDQALLGIVAAKHFFVRQFGLAGKVVILDEVHTYDLYTSTLIDSLVSQLRELHCTVIVLSATLTEKRGRELLGLTGDHPASAGYPLVSGIAGSLVEHACEPPPSRTIQVRHVPGAFSPQEAIDRARRGECSLWIRNTVDEAQATYRALQSASFQGGPSIALLHSRFPFFRREQLEADWMTRLGKDSTNRPKGCILVSTQVAEQSVDIDADMLITDLAPTDMLLQRLGRLWRHDRPARPCLQPEVWIQMPQSKDGSLWSSTEEEIRAALGKSARVYAPYILLRSLREWHSRATLTLPDDIRPILEATYADVATDEPPAWQELRSQLEKQKEGMARLALSATRIWTNPALEDEEGVQTRWSRYRMAKLLLATEIIPIDSYSVHLCLLDGSVVTPHERNWSFLAAKAIYRNLAPVPRWGVAAILGESPPWLTNHVGQPAAVGVVQRDGRIRWPGREHETGLSYHTDLGIIINRELVPRAPREESDESYD